MTKSFFVTSTGTHIGKTLVTAALTYQLRSRGAKVCALKPVISGWEPEDMQMDTNVLLRAQGAEVTPEEVDKISPWRFKEPLSPNMAAEMEGREIDVSEVVDFCKAPRDEYDYVFIETVGGAMVPLTYEAHSMHWMMATGFPAIVVVGTYLGAISHTFTTLAAMEHYGMKVQGVVIVETCDSQVDFGLTVQTIRAFIEHHVPVVELPKIDAEKDIWKAARNLLPVLSEAGGANI